MNVKGSIFIPVVKAIKSDKSGAFNTYFTDADKDIISQKILPSIWYPFDTYKRCINALFEVFGKKDPESAREWGRTASQAAMTTMYAAFVTKRDPISFLNKYEMVHKNFYDFGKIDVISEKENQVSFKLTNFDPQCVPIFYLIQGWLERGMELCGAKNINIVFLTKSWEGRPDTSFRITWTT